MFHNSLWAKQTQIDDKITDEPRREVLGRIIADSEAPVRDATGRSRQRLYEKALRLPQQQSEPAFSPRQTEPEQTWREEICGMILERGPAASGRRTGRSNAKQSRLAQLPGRDCFLLPQ